MQRLIIFLFSFVFLHCLGLNAQIRLPRLIGDGMVLQRNSEIKLWGWSASSELIILDFKGQTFTTKANSNGEWQFTLPPQQVGGPFQLVFRASNTVTINNVMFGDVWVCSGQSNMELPMKRVQEKYHDIVAQAENPNIRQFLVPDEYNFKHPQENLSEGAWQSADPVSVLNFSAVAYFFAKQVYEKYHVPIGLINASLGGSPVEAWMSEDALKEFPNAYHELQRFKSDSLIQSIKYKDSVRTNQWYDSLNRMDKGLQQSPDWKSMDVDDSDWPTMNIPGYWSGTELEPLNGVVWFRKTVEVPKHMVGKPVKLTLGRIIDSDEVFVNEKWIGSTGYQYPPRRYKIDAGILKEGSNVVAIRVVNNAGTGGFVPDKPYTLVTGNDTLDLRGQWKYRIGATMPALESQTFIRWKPGGLYNSMISPLQNYAIKGVIWYQGESNTGDPLSYYKTFPAMISDWRKRWNQGEFPFLYVQLTNFMEPSDKPVESNWAELRHAQLKTLAVRNTGMAVTIDLGKWNDIHPENKENVGKRLALLANKIAYGEKNIIASGPTPTDAEFQQKTVLIKFTNVGLGLETKDGKTPKHFAISNNGKDFVWAKAEIIGNTVKVWNEKIKNPTVVRYAWANNPDTANLYNKEGLPASPFEISK